MAASSLSFGRGPRTWLLFTLCLFGLVRIGMGAIVPIKAVAAQILLQRAFDRSLAVHRPQKPWPWADMAPAARILVPRLGVDSIVLDSGSGQAMAFGPTLLPGSARLAGPGTTVIAAHRDTHFRFLKDVRPGDRIAVEGVDGAWHAYRATGGEVVRWDHFAIAGDAPTNQLALTTCYPFTAIRHGPLRYVLWAAPL